MRDHQLRNNARDFPMQINPDPSRVLRTLAAATVATPGTLPAQPAGSVVKVRGPARPGPGGVLTAPISGRPCVWYRCYQQPGRGARPVPDVTPSDGPLVHHTGARTRTKWQAGDEISETPFAVGGPDGELVIDPRRVDVDTDVLSANEADRPWFGLTGLVVEWILPVDAPVLAVGTLERADAASPPRLVAADGWALVSTKDEARIEARNRRSAELGVHDLEDRALHLMSVNDRLTYWAPRVGAAVVALAVVVTVLVLVIIYA